MRYHNITQDDMNNGDGLRVVLWVAGCEHHCKGCQNPVTWNPDDGLVFDKRAFNEIMKALEKPYVAGITFSGGDPLPAEPWSSILHHESSTEEISEENNMGLHRVYMGTDSCKQISACSSQVCRRTGGWTL